MDTLQEFENKRKEQQKEGEGEGEGEGITDWSPPKSKSPPKKFSKVCCLLLLLFSFWSISYLFFLSEREEINNGRWHCPCAFLFCL